MNRRVFELGYPLIHPHMQHRDPNRDVSKKNLYVCATGITKRIRRRYAAFWWGRTRKNGQKSYMAYMAARKN
jgi:hypothetical protein